MPPAEGLQGLEALEDALAGWQRLEAPRRAEAIPGGDMAPRDRLGGLARGAVQPRPGVPGHREDVLHGLDVRPVVIADERRGRGARASERLAEEGLRRRGVPAVTVEDIERLALLVDGPVQVAFLLPLPPEEEDLIDPPPVAGAPPGAYMSASVS